MIDSYVYRGSGVLDASTDLCESPVLGDAEHPLAHIALSTFDSSADRSCLRCRGDRLHRHGKGRTGMQRRRCRDCSRTFSSTTDTMLAGLHAQGKLGIVVSDMLSTEPSFCRRLASALQPSKMTIWVWRQKVSRAFAAIRPVSGNDGEDVATPSAAGLAVMVLRESRKASREWVDHQRDPARFPTPDRLRWVDYRMHGLPLPQPMPPHLVTVSFDANGRSWYQPGLMLFEADILATATESIDMPFEWAQGSGADVIATDPSPARRSALKFGATRYQSTGKRIFPHDGSDLDDRFQTFVRTFSGPATKHLGGCLAWFDARLRASGDGCTRYVWRATLDALSTRSPMRFWDMLNLAVAGQQQRSAAA